MIVQVLFAFALFVPALSCSTGLGDSIKQNPTFTFEISPPLSWTWYQPNATAFNYPGQEVNQADALRNMKNAFDGAILTAAQKLGYSTIGMTWTITGYNPQMMWVVDSTQANKAPLDGYSGSYIPGLGAVISQRGAYVNTAYVVTDFCVKVTVNVRGSGVYSMSQWQTFSDQVFNRLTIYNKVRFCSPVTIT
uniref:Uncharacterized protein n=1 Tax=Panagrolaimus sp. ES5 TaxID=591445 RepID=A0AC34GF79_9BILA